MTKRTGHLIIIQQIVLVFMACIFTVLFYCCGFYHFLLQKKTTTVYIAWRYCLGFKITRQDPKYLQGISKKVRSVLTDANRLWPYVIGPMTEK